MLLFSFHGPGWGGKWICLSFCSFGALFVSVVADEQGKSRFGKQSDLIIQLRFGTSLVKASTAYKAKAKLIFGQYIVLFVNMKCLIFNQIKKKICFDTWLWATSWITKTKLIRSGAYKHVHVLTWTFERFKIHKIYSYEFR